MRRLLLAITIGVALGLVIVWFWFGRAHLRPAAPTAQTTPAATTPASQRDTRRIRATLFYVGADGLKLTGVDREVPYAETTVDQARALIQTLLEPVQPPLASAVPAGTTLQTLFVTEKGEAFVDLSPEIVSKHSGGALDELFTVYAIVNTLTVNLPAITHVQLLVAGKEVESIAGHIDLRRPLPKNLEWTRAPGEAAPPAPPAAPAAPAGAAGAAPPQAPAPASPPPQRQP